MTCPRIARLFVMAMILTLPACSGLLPKPLPPMRHYTLDSLPGVPPPAGVATPITKGLPTLSINPPRADAGFDSAHIVYLRTPYQLEYFAHSAWVDTPARLLAPLILSTLEASGSFGAVVQMPSAAVGELRLDTRIVRLQQDFAVTPSLVRFTLRATLVDTATLRVLATREFDASVAATREDAYGGVVAAQAAVQQVLGALAGFCKEAVSGWRSKF